MASGDVAASARRAPRPIATAISQGLDVELFWILEDIAAAEALVARDGSGVNTVADLKGKKVGAPFVSTTPLPPAVRDGAGGPEAHRRAGAQHAPARDRGRLGARRHRRDLHLGPGAGHDQEERQGDRDLRRAVPEGQVHVRRADRVEEVRGRESGVHGRAGQGDRQGRRRLPRQPEGLDGGQGQGRRGGQVVGRQAGERGRGRSRCTASRQPRRAGLAQVAGRRRERRRGQGADRDRQVPEGGGTHPGQLAPDYTASRSTPASSRAR